MSYVYKCVPVPQLIETGKDAHLSAVRSYESLINKAADGGWELHQIDTITSTKKPGCSGALFGS